MRLSRGCDDGGDSCDDGFGGCGYCATMAVVVVGSGGDHGGVGGDAYGGRRVELEVRRLEVVEVTMVMWGVRFGGGR
ncbi:hypothetical protein Tco_0010816 [Tanacetum coccineum]